MEGMVQIDVANLLESIDSVRSFALLKTALKIWDIVQEAASRKYRVPDFF
jgi:hypothetical protein